MEEAVSKYEHTQKRITQKCQTIPLPNSLVHKPLLRQRQALRRRSLAHNPIRLNNITLRIDPHARHRVIVAHVLFANVATVLDGFDALVEVVGCDRARGNRGGGHKEDAGFWDQRREHWAGDDGLDCGDGCVGVALMMGC